MKKKKVPINYYSRDFDSIKESLVQHAKRYYPDSYKDFSEVGFGSLMLDTVSYVGDVLSFYLDYQVNESFLDTANEGQNIIKIAKQMGYKFNSTVSSQGIATFYCFVPANSIGNDIDRRYLPTIKKGSTVRSENGTQFILVEDVVVEPRSYDDLRVGRKDENDNVTYYIVRSSGIVISGEYQNVAVQVGDIQKFLRVRIPVENITEIVSVFDADGNEYFEVDYLTQDIVYKAIKNNDSSKTYASSVMRPYSVPRRYVIERDGVNTYLQFGQGQDESETVKQKLIDPSQRILKYHAKNYFVENTFDPSNFVETDKFGVVPYNTTLQIAVRTNKNTNVNIGINKLNVVNNLNIEFEDSTQLNSSVVSFIVNSFEVTNEEPIIGKVEEDTLDEIKIKSKNIFASQNRAVTAEDYQALIYKMPNEFGAIKRAAVIRDLNSFKRNLNIYVLSEDENGYLTNTNSIIKENLKVWLNNYKMINDTIDILDAKIVNIGVEFQILSDTEENRYDTLVSAKAAVSDLFQVKPQIGESVFINDIIKALKTTKGVLDVVSVNVTNKNGGSYSSIVYDTEANLTKDGRMVKIPENVMYELKFPNIDIKGVVL